MGALLTIFLIIIDQATKYITITNLNVFETYPLIPDIFHFTYYRNTGAAFSLLSNHTWILIVISFIAIIFMMIFLYKKTFTHKLGIIATYIILAGAIGNLIDRLIYGYVIDMFDFRIINFAVFNVADIFVSIGGAMLMYYIIFLHEKGKLNDRI